MEFFVCFLITPISNGFVIASPCWLFSSIFNILVTIFYLCKHFFFILILYKTFRFVFLTPSLFFGKRILLSNARRVFMQLKPPIRVFSKASTFLVFIGREIITFLIFLCMQSLGVLVDEYFLGLNLFFHHHLSERLKNFTQIYRILKIVNIVQIGNILHI